jgi:hypothetical protein
MFMNNIGAFCPTLFMMRFVPTPERAQVGTATG